MTNDVEALSAGEGCYAAFLTPKGKMLGDLRILDAGDELLLDTERVALQELFNMIRRFSIGYDVELHKRTLERGLLSLIGPGAEAVVGGAGSLAEAEHAHAAVSIGGRRAPGRSGPTSGSTCSATPPTPTALRAALDEAGAVPVSEAVGRVPARRARPAALRRRPRRHA